MDSKEGIEIITVTLGQLFALMNSKYYIGFHTSSSPSFSAGLQHAVDRKSNAVAFFIGNPRSWSVGGSVLELEQKGTDMIEFKRICRENGIVPEALLPHSAYLTNLASCDNDIWQKSIARLTIEMRVAGKLGALCVNVHPGSWNGSTRENGIERVVTAMERIFADKQTGKVKICLEMMAGSKAGTRFGDDLDFFGAVLAKLKVESKSRFGVCVDTAHLWGAGFDIRSPTRVNSFFDRFERTVGDPTQYILGYHFNDTPADLGSHVDRHENIGNGQLGPATFRAMLMHKATKRKPIILETPTDENNLMQMTEIILLRDIAGETVEGFEIPKSSTDSGEGEKNQEEEEELDEDSEDSDKISDIITVQSQNTQELSSDSDDSEIEVVEPPRHMSKR